MFYYNFTGDVSNASVQGIINHFNNNRVEQNFKDEFCIYLSSTGGDIDAGIRLYDFLKAIPNKVAIYGFGQVDSAAIMIYLAGDTRVALKDTRFRFHPPQYNLIETHAPLSYYQEVVGYFGELDRRMKEIVVLQTKRTQKDIDSLYSQGKILTADEAKNSGIVQTVTNQLPIPQHYINQFTNANSLSP